MAHTMRRNDNVILVPNRYCQRSDGTFHPLNPDSTRQAYLAFCLLVFLKTERKWSLTLNELCERFPVDTQRARALRTLKECLVHLVQRSHVTVIDRQRKKQWVSSRSYELAGDFIRKCKPSTKLDIKVPGSRKGFFEVPRTVLTVAESCGYRGLALYLILCKNRYRDSNGVFSSKVARLSIENLCEISCFTNQTVLKYLKLLEENRFIVSHNDNVNKQHDDGTFKKDTANEYVIIDPTLTLEERREAATALNSTGTVKDFTARHKENIDNKFKRIQAGFIPAPDMVAQARATGPDPFVDDDDDEWGSIPPNGFRPGDAHYDGSDGWRSVAMDDVE